MGIKDLGYSRFDGPLDQGSSPVWVIATTELSLFWSYLRTKLLFIAILFIQVPFLIATMAERYFVEKVAQVKAEDVAGLLFYWLGRTETWLLFIMFAGVGCGIIANDIRHRTIQLYFSKPIASWQYIAGKLLALILLGLLATAIPTLLVGGMRLVMHLPLDSFQASALEFVGLVAFNIVILAVFSLMVMALSCLSDRSGYVVLSWLAIIFVPAMVSFITGLVFQDQPWPGLLSISGSLGMALEQLVGYKSMEVPLVESASYMKWAYIPLLVLLAGGAYAIIDWRTRKLEGIT